MKQIPRILLVDDHAIVRTGYRYLLQQHHPEIEILEAETGEKGCQMFFENRPDLLIMDLSLSGIGGLAAIKRIVSRMPEAHILVFSIHDEAAYVSRAFEAGALGYITKSCAPETMLEAVYSVMRGNRYLQAGLTPSAESSELTEKHNLENLSQKEFEVFCMLAKGMTTRQIAENLHLGQKTIANYQSIIKTKLAVNTPAEMTHLAFASGLIRAPHAQAEQTGTDDMV